jgi:hypothetical protein
MPAGIGSLNARSRHALNSLPPGSTIIGLMMHGPFTAIVSPVVLDVFGGQWSRLNGYLFSKGARAVYSASIGVEPAVERTMAAIRAAGGAPLILSSCAATVAHIRSRQPELLAFLSPAPSPLKLAMEIVRLSSGGPAALPFLVVSPCLSKKRESEVSGEKTHNVTIAELKASLEAQDVHLGAFAALPYSDGFMPPTAHPSISALIGERAARELAGLAFRMERVSGAEEARQYLSTLKGRIDAGTAPLLIDVQFCVDCLGGGPPDVN